MITVPVLLSLIAGHVLGGELAGIGLGWAGLHGGVGAIMAALGTKTAAELSTGLGIASGGVGVGSWIHQHLGRLFHHASNNPNLTPAQSAQVATDIHQVAAAAGIPPIVNAPVAPVVR